MKMGLWTLLMMSGFIYAAYAGEVDPRFDGKWIGREDFVYYNLGRTVTMRALYTMIAIAEHGTLVGVVSGLAPGRHGVSAQSHGNTLIYRRSTRECTLTLSADGNALIESGHADVVLAGNSKPTYCEVSATFHRLK